MLIKQIQGATTVLPKILTDGLYFSLLKRKLIKNPYEDCYIVSYPKSGRTWLRVMLDYLHVGAKYTHDSANTLYNIESPFDPTEIGISDLQNAKILFLIRDPRAVILSSYFQAMKHKPLVNKFKTISDFVYDDKMGIKALIEFQNAWLSLPEAKEHPKKFHVIRYEDLRTKTHETLVDIMTFFDTKHINHQKVKNTIQTFEIDNMRVLEEMHILKIRYGRRLKPGNKKDANSFKTRKGEIKGYTKKLPKEELEYCNEMVEKHSLLYKGA